MAKQVDLFDSPELIPKKVNCIFEKYYAKYGDCMDYKDTQAMLDEVNKVGYTFEYYLDNVPYALRPIGVKLNEVEGYED